jgi:hypothetical protein
MANYDEQDATNIRLLLIGDSHCREMGGFISSFNKRFEVMTISKGRQHDEIIYLFRSRTFAATRFNPHAIVIHFGHNDLSFHAKHNAHRALSRDMASVTGDFAQEVQSFCPGATIHLSAVFTRTQATKSTLSPIEVVAYNRTAKRHGQRIREVADELGYQYIYNMPLWHKISKYEETKNMHNKDGLNLNETGSKAIAKCWVEHILGEMKKQKEAARLMATEQEEGDGRSQESGDLVT